MSASAPVMTPGHYIARAVGINQRYNATSSTYTRLIPRAIEYDLAPERIPGQRAGIIVLMAGTDQPSGNFYARTPGIWRFEASVVSEPWQAGRTSEYLLLIDRGPNGTDWINRAYCNVIGARGFHPSLRVSAHLRVTEPRYFSFDYRYYGVEGAPAQWKHVPGDLYAIFEAERVMEV